MLDNGLVPVNMQLELKPLRLVIQESFSEMSVNIEMNYLLQWEDERLFQHPCFGALEGTPPAMPAGRVPSGDGAGAGGASGSAGATVPLIAAGSSFPLVIVLPLLPARSMLALRR